jgi:hypothetical protein
MNGNSNKISLEDFRNSSPLEREVLRDIEEHLENPLGKTTEKREKREEQRELDPGGEGLKKKKNNHT